MASESDYLDVSTAMSQDRREQAPGTTICGIPDAFVPRPWTASEGRRIL